MRIVDLLSKDSILLNASPKNKAEAIDLLVDLQVKGGKITDREAYKQGILAREENGSTAVGVPSLGPKIFVDPNINCLAS